MYIHYQGMISRNEEEEEKKSKTNSIYVIHLTKEENRKNRSITICSLLKILEGFPSVFVNETTSILSKNHSKMIDKIDTRRLGPMLARLVF